MASRLNTLYLGSAADAADALEVLEARCEIAQDDLRLALINALRRIQLLEEQLARLLAQNPR